MGSWEGLERVEHGQCRRRGLGQVAWDLQGSDAFLPLAFDLVTETKYL